MSFRDLTRSALSVVIGTFKEKELATYTKAGSGPPVTAQIQAVIDENYESVDPDSGVFVSGKEYSALVAKQDLPTGCPGNGDKLTRGSDSKVFRVIDWQTDGHSGMLLILQSD